MCSLTQRSGPSIRRFIHNTAAGGYINNNPTHKRDCHCDHHHDFLYDRFLHVTTPEHDNIKNCDVDYCHRRVSSGLWCPVRASNRSCWRTGVGHSLR